MTTQLFKDHWLNIDPQRMESYEEMYRWNPATEIFYSAADIRPGLVVCDFGCGPGHASIEFARRVEETGHVHALDINAEFIRRTRERAARHGFEERISAHLLVDDQLPLRDQSVDRTIARNTIIYVANPTATFTEFKRVLKSGGIAHAIESDWPLTVVKPVATEDWRKVVGAASWAWRDPEQGRNLYGHVRDAGFEKIALQVLTCPDTEGRLLGMARTVIGYARESGKLSSAFLDNVLETIESGIERKTYLAIAPQFIVTATT